MKRTRIAAMICAGMMMTASVPAGVVTEMPVIAEDSVRTGQCGENLTYELDDYTDTLVISGTGAMTNYNRVGYYIAGTPYVGEEGRTYTKYEPRLFISTKTIISADGSVLEEQAQAVPWSFRQIWIRYIQISDGVTSIGDLAFYGCNIYEITIPDGAVRIGSASFAKCDKLQTVTIPYTITKIEPDAFEECKNLTIRGYSGSAAETYANENNISFESIGEAPMIETPTETIVTTLFGDLDNSGEIDILDVIAVNKFLLGIREVDQTASDVNRDNRCDAEDALLIMKYALEIIHEFPQSPVPQTEQPTESVTEPSVAPIELPTESPTEQPTVDERVLVAEIVNSKRAENGLPALNYDERLAELAQIRAEEMAVVQSHTRPNGKICTSILDENGIRYSAAAENIAWDVPYPKMVMEIWMESTGHRANILSPNLKSFGVGCYSANGTKYWVQLFATII